MCDSALLVDSLEVLIHDSPSRQVALTLPQRQYFHYSSADELGRVLEKNVYAKFLRFIVTGRCVNVPRLTKT